MASNVAEIRRARVERLLAIYHSATEDQKHAGRNWYSDAREVVRGLAQQHGIYMSTVAAVFSALSPQTRWHTNVAGAVRILNAFRNGEYEAPSNVTLYYRNAQKAWRILDGSLRAFDAFAPHSKTEAFWHNLIGNENVVTIDTWMVRGMEGKAFNRKRTIHPNMYRDYSEVVVAASHAVGETPAQFQAIVWIALRGSGE